MCLAFSFLLSGMEAGLFALNRVRIRQQRNAGNEAARLLYGYLENPESFLWTIVIGNSLANVFAVSLLVYWLQTLFWQHWAWMLLTLAPLVFAIYVFADLLPKMLFRQSPDRWCLRLVVPFRFVHLTLTPLVVFVSWLAGLALTFTGAKRFTGKLFGNRDELRMVMQESAQSLTTEERKMVNRVLDLQTCSVGDIAVPLDQVVAVMLRTPLKEVFELCQSSSLTRLPVREEKQGRVLGIISLKSVLYLPDVDMHRLAMDFVQPAAYFDSTLKLEVALQRFRKTGQRMAIVLSPQGKEIGILTLEDILRFLVGKVSF